MQAGTAKLSSHINVVALIIMSGSTFKNEKRYTATLPLITASNIKMEGTTDAIK